MEEAITSKVMMAKTNVTYRQLHYWQQNGIISLAREDLGGRRPKYWKKSDIPKITVLGRVAKAFGDMGLYPKIDFLREVYNHYEDGCIVLSNDVVISWDEEDW